ncbi:hypothetical protein RF55_4422 [Lasius niger]|uniref:Uncharacterized protein n=1 Tax=Lasius niger TaxID=67767 RepID=A0A0J7KYI8_LASNI|nr:hypothetical protein RF55_4422 [Lasius niger]
MSATLPQVGRAIPKSLNYPPNTKYRTRETSTLATLTPSTFDPRIGQVAENLTNEQLRAEVPKDFAVEDLPPTDS